MVTVFAQFRDGQVRAQGHALRVKREAGNHFELGASEQRDLSFADVILMRQDPPFDMGYITATHILEKVHPATLVVNDPAAVRNAPEKLFVTQFPDLMPPTLITSDPMSARNDVQYGPAHTTVMSRTRMPDSGRFSDCKSWLDMLNDPLISQGHNLVVSISEAGQYITIVLS